MPELRAADSSAWSWMPPRDQLAQMSVGNLLSVNSYASTLLQLHK
jgi:hypothetical protein